jgi:hypothetical protein
MSNDQDYADANEDEAAGDPAIDFDRVGEVAEAFATLKPLDALKSIYGDRLEVPE